MGGYGALLLAEKNPELIAAVAAISPAVWTTYSEARAANSSQARSSRRSSLARELSRSNEVTMSRNLPEARLMMVAASSNRS